jgi:hypothetical protein
MRPTTKLRLVLLGVLVLFLPLYSATSAPGNGLPVPIEEPSEGGGSGGAGGCTISSCQTTCTGPTGVECCCFYTCPSGSTWVCKSGYCSNSHGGCL